MKQNFSIPNPCTENWDQMTPTKRGAFCQKCTKEVHDLSNSSLAEVRAKLTGNPTGSICVRIKTSQLKAVNDQVEQWYQPDETFNHRLFLFSLFLVFGMTVFNGSAQVSHLAKELQTTQQVDAVILNAAVEVHKNSNPEPLFKGEVTMGSPMKRNDEPSPEESPKTTNIEIDSIPISPKEQIIETPEPIPFNIIAYPNPARAQTTLKIDLPDTTKFAIKMFSPTGNQVRSYGTMEFPPGTSEFEIDLQSLARGTYIIGFQGDEISKTIYVKKL